MAASFGFVPRPVHLLLENLLNLAGLLLNLAADLFGLAFGPQVGPIRDLSCFSLTLPFISFHFMQHAFDLILRGQFHSFSPLFF
jgi:hypothetical protein